MSGPPPGSPRRQAPEMIFVLGPPRSGTTLLQSLLAAHSQIASLYETAFFVNVLPALLPSEQTPESPFPVERGLKLIVEQAANEGVRMDAERLARVLRGRTCREVFEYLVATHATKASTWVVEKTPRNVWNIPLIRRYYPRARLIGIVRHPVECAGSRTAVRAPRLTVSWGGRFKSHRLSASLWVTDCLELIEGVDEFTRVETYERLVGDPEGVLRGLCDFIGAPYETRMLERFSETARSFVRVSATPWKQLNLSGAIIDRRRYWRGRMPRGSAWLIERIAGPLLGRFGYEPSSRPSRAQRVRASLRDRLAEYWTACCSFRDPSAPAFGRARTLLAAPFEERDPAQALLARALALSGWQLRGMSSAHVPALCVAALASKTSCLCVSRILRVHRMPPHPILDGILLTVLLAVAKVLRKNVTLWIEDPPAPGASLPCRLAWRSAVSLAPAAAGSEAARARLSLVIGRRLAARVRVLSAGSFRGYLPALSERDEVRKRWGISREKTVAAYCLGGVRDPDLRGLSAAARQLSAACGGTLLVSGWGLTAADRVRLRDAAASADAPWRVERMSGVCAADVFGACDFVWLSADCAWESSVARLTRSTHKPLLAPRAGAYPELLNDAQVFLYDPDDAREPAQSLRRVLEAARTAVTREDSQPLRRPPDGGWDELAAFVTGEARPAPRTDVVQSTP